MKENGNWKSEEKCDDRSDDKNGLLLLIITTATAAKQTPNTSPNDQSESKPNIGTNRTKWPIRKPMACAVLCAEFECLFIDTEICLDVYHTTSRLSYVIGLHAVPHPKDASARNRIFFVDSAASVSLSLNSLSLEPPKSRNISFLGPNVWTGSWHVTASSNNSTAMYLPSLPEASSHATTLSHIYHCLYLFCALVFVCVCGVCTICGVSIYWFHMCFKWCDERSLAGCVCVWARRMRNYNNKINM